MNDFEEWKKQQHAKQALEAVCERKEIQTILSIEPAVQNILALASDPEPRENRWISYEALKRMSSSYVGWDARESTLRSSEHYDALLSAIDELLPQPGEDTGEVA